MTEGAPLRSMMYLLDIPEREVWSRVCTEWSQAHGYNLVSMVVDDPTNPVRWRDVVRMLAGRPTAEGIVAKVRDQLGRGPVAMDDVERAIREAFAVVGIVADVCIVPRLDHLPVHRLPRVELIAESVVHSHHLR